MFQLHKIFLNMVTQYVQVFSQFRVTDGYIHLICTLRNFSLQDAAFWIHQAAVDDDDDSDVDFFGEETEEEKKAAEDRAGKAKTSGKKKESGKSSVLMDVKPWDDETDMKKLEEAVRSVHLDGLLWGAFGYGIKKLQIMMTIVDDLVSVDTLIEERLCEEPINEYVQSYDIVAFNKIYEEQRKRDAEEMGDAMKSLESRTFCSKRKMDILSALDERNR